MAKLSVENVTYRYKNSETAAVKNVSCMRVSSRKYVMSAASTTSPISTVPSRPRGTTPLAISGPCSKRTR